MPKLDESAAGVYIIACTPFGEDGALDLDSADRMVDFYAARGVTGITLLGMMGEAPKLTHDEARALVRRVLARAGALPVVVGVSAPGFAPMRELAQAVMDDGAAGVMVAPPGTMRTDEQLYGYFATVAETLGDMPWILQDYPLAAGVQIPSSVIARVVKDMQRCVMLKHEDWPGLAKITWLRARMSSGELRRISILVGNGGLFLPEELARGADGAMTGFAYPEMMVEVWKAVSSGRIDRAQDVFDAYLPLARYEQQPGIGLAIRKYVLCKRGAIATPALRKPGPQLSQLDIAEIDRLIARQERRLRALG
jgi:4-hydroxy-tetrahydrodipicolinate synthase